MAAEKTKKTGIGKPRLGRKADFKASSPGEEYSEVLELIGRPLDCIINVSREHPSGNFMMMKIDEERRTVPFKDENGAYSYKTLTHILTAGGFTFGLSCSRYGEVELYQVGGDGDELSHFIAKKKVAGRVLDPMFAFAATGHIYIVFNEPTPSIVAAGVKARKPVQSDEDELLVIASGRPRVVLFDTSSDAVKLLLPKTKPIPRYVAGLVDDPSGDIPMLMVANVLVQTESEKEAARPSFKEMISRYLYDEEEILPVKEESFPVGISVAKICEGEKFVPVPMSGDHQLGILGVSLSEGTDDNTIRFATGEAEEGQLSGHAPADM